MCEGKELSMVVLAGVVVHNGKCMIGRRAIHKSNGGLWEFPGGKREENESDQDALIREFMEEFGMKISVGEYIGSFPFESSQLSIELRVWFATQRTKPIHATDHDIIEWITSSQLENYIFSPADIPVVQFLLRTNHLSEIF